MHINNKQNPAEDFSKVKVFFILLLILAAGTFLRSWNLGTASFWVDELNTFYSAQSFSESGEYTMPSGVPYTRASSQLWLTSVVFNYLEPNEASTRLVSVLFGMLGVLMIYIIGRRFFNWKVGLFAAFLMAFSHFEIGWSRTARVYTIFQFLTLLFTYFFLLALESRRPQNVHSLLRIKGDSLFTKIRYFCSRWGFTPGWLLPAAAVIGFTYFFVHKLSLFTLVSIFVYLTIMTSVMILIQLKIEKTVNKYSLLLIFALVSGAALLLIWSDIIEMIKFFLNYTPPWAQSGDRGADRMRLISFLFSQYRTPLATLFCIGSVHAFTRFNSRAFMIFIFFTVPLLLLSLVFTHRTEVYIFNVYPFFLLLAAYGGVNLVGFETRISKGLVEKSQLPATAFMSFVKRVLPAFITICFLAIFIVTPWLRVSLNIPFNSDGITNGAVTPAEWREGSSIIKEYAHPDDLILSSLPATSRYYFTEADYSINWALYKQAREEDFKDDEGRWIEVYAGIQCVENMNELRSLISAHPAGWIILETFHLTHPIYIPAEVKNFFDTEMGEPITTENGTIVIYHWSEKETTN